ncbi:flagellar assembly peptidoglycan hydrolase FlgJ [Natronospira bacteriovora]|uniref:Peptidoglycan hydrolase FlgJ n=1 Tax=Natronospira bacteriovora TaxID=3069753 RepID=A0ABU0W3A0_9GAMM|nr:flagellar assembly peptidoglycan hydrolase FlgJ [Natronospira sp. AB-CW4]MDQ2068487.1 flagellar assembly peptidoglycan hydrolase FlgJ [Natronospira sp. AB-CW4]
MISGDKPVFTDLHSLEGLRGKARRDDPEALREVARHFESLFTHMMLKSMRAASFGDDLTGGYQMDFYRDMFDQQIAVEMSQGQGLGLADLIVRQLGGESVAGPGQGGSGMRDTLEALRARAMPVVENGASVRASETAGAADSDRDDFSPEGPQEFVQKLLPLARRAANRLGVAPQLILAQAALETGWGQHMIRDESGRNSFNLFGIKAGNGWQGQQMSVPTLEFEDGLPVRRVDRFRAYGSLEESINDYARFLSRSPRYQQALGQGDDAAAFGQALQAGGYATDPAYAEKIQRVARSPLLRTVGNGASGDNAAGGNGLKDFPNRPYE